MSNPDTGTVPSFSVHVMPDGSVRVEHAVDCCPEDAQRLQVMQMQHLTGPDVKR